MLQKGKLSIGWEAPPPFCTLHQSGERPWGCSCFKSRSLSVGRRLRRWRHAVPAALSISSSPCQTCPQSCSKTCTKPGGLLRRSEWQIRFKVLSGKVCPLVRACLRSDCRYDEELHYLRSPEWTTTTFNRNSDRGFATTTSRAPRKFVKVTFFCCRETDCTRSVQALKELSTSHCSPTRSRSCNLAI